jgi:RNA polymerase sigma-70 factor (ECF subfamily)
MELFDQLRAPLLRYVLSFGLTLHDAEEVVQEVFLSLFRHLQLRRSRSNLRGWLFRVAHNLALKLRQSRHRFCETGDADWTLLNEPVDPSPTPEEHLLIRQRQRRLQAVLSALSVQDQCCLRLRAEGLRYREIAEVLGMSLGAISLSLTQSFARLKRADGSCGYAEK